MPFSAIAALLADCLTIVCACVVAKRSSNWRIRFLAFTVALLPLSQGVILLGDHQIWVSPDMRSTMESMELLISALCLTAVHLLNTENVDRRNTDVRLRVAEEMPWQERKS